MLLTLIDSFKSNQLARRCRRSRTMRFLVAIFVLPRQRDSAGAGDCPVSSSHAPALEFTAALPQLMSTGRTLQSQVDSNPHSLESIVSLAFVTSFTLNWAIILRLFCLQDCRETCLRVRLSKNKCDLVRNITSTVKQPSFLIEDCLRKYLAHRWS